MLGNCKILKYNAFYGRVVRENAYGIHSRTRWTHLACVTNIWRQMLWWLMPALEWMPYAYNLLMKLLCCTRGMLIMWSTGLIIALPKTRTGRYIQLSPHWSIILVSTITCRISHSAGYHTEVFRTRTHLCECRFRPRCSWETDEETPKWIVYAFADFVSVITEASKSTGVPMRSSQIREWAGQQSQAKLKKLTPAWTKWFPSSSAKPKVHAHSFTRYPMTRILIPNWIFWWRRQNLRFHNEAWCRCWQHKEGGQQ